MIRYYANELEYRTILGVFSQIGAVRVEKQNVNLIIWTLPKVVVSAASKRKQNKASMH